MLPKRSPRLLTLGLIAGLSVGCGEEFSSSDGAGGGGSAGAAGSAGTAGTAGIAGEGGAGGAPTLEQFCVSFATAVCELAQGCCTASGQAPGPSCVEALGASCLADVEEVRAGSMTFAPDQIEACVAGLGEYYAACTPSVKDLLDLNRKLRPCALMFEGARGVDAGCARDSQCEVPRDANVVRSCDETTKRCKQERIFQLNEPCVPGRDLCDNGLYCRGEPGTGYSCAPVTPLGNTCSPLAPGQCGLGAYCDQLKCVPALAGGEPCAGALECQSLRCEQLKCAPLEPVAAPPVCEPLTSGG